MGQVEAADLVLVPPDGPVWSQTQPRANGHWLRHDVKRTLDGARVRACGDSAVLTGVLTNATPHGAGMEAELVACVREGGR